MPRVSKSQWEFGELFPTEQTRKVWTVAELTGRVRQLLEDQIGEVWVAGEVSNLRLQSSGHCYFTLKDAASQLSCVLFRREGGVPREALQDGAKIVLRGDLSVYEPRGQYQIIVRQVELQGVGALQAAFERLKAKLQAEGLFAPERKRLISGYPQVIGVVTSPTAAALQDVLHVVERRNPALRLILAPCRVQGDGAAAEIAGALALLNGYAKASSADSSAGEPPMDAILVTRGGGSIEDLWAFNDESVARAIASSALPVVSAVGHEIDFTISDFVADLRAATPSAAAELLTEGVFAAADFIAESPTRLSDALLEALKTRSEELAFQRGRLTRCHPRRRLEDAAQRLDELASQARRGAREGERRARADFRAVTDRLSRVRPLQLLAERRERIVREVIRMRELASHQWQRQADRAHELEGQLRLLGPEQVLGRGYSITLDAATGNPVRDAARVKRGQRLRTRLQRGEITSRVETSGGG